MSRPAKQPSPVDQRDLARIRAATHFNAMVFLGRGAYDREDGFPTLPEAKAAALLIEARNPRKRAMVYAVTAEGHSTMVTDDLEAML